MATTTRKIDISKAGLLSRLSLRIHELEIERINKEVSAREYKALRAGLLRDEAAIMAKPAW